MPLSNIRTLSGHHRWHNSLVRNIRQHTTVTLSGAILCLHAQFALPDEIPLPKLSWRCLSSALHRPVPLCFTATSPDSAAGEPDESWGSSSQTPTTPASKCSFQSGHLLESTRSQCWLKGRVELQEPQVRPARRVMEMSPLVLQDRQDSREPDWTGSGIKLA